MAVQKPLLLLACWLICLGSDVLAQAETSRQEQRQQTERELKQLREQIQKLQQNQAQKRTELSREQKALKQLDLSINQSNQSLSATRNQLRSSQQELKRLQDRERQLNITKTEQQQALAEQIRAAYMGGKQEHIKVLLNQEDPARLARALRYYEYLNQARSEKISALKSTLEELAAVIPAITTEQQRLSTLEQSQADENKKLLALKSERQSLLEQLQRQVKNNDKTLSEWQANEKDLVDILDALEQRIAQLLPEQSLEGLAKLKNTLNWPVKGPLKERFGRSRQGSSLRWSGVLIGAPAGSTVHALHHGRVVYSDYLRGFGLITIIDHGAGYMSLYGHNEALYKNTGDWVEAGEPIATVGQTGGYPDNGLYFEIRHKSKAINPVQFIRRG